MLLTDWGCRGRYVLAHLDTEAHDVPGLPHAAIEMLKEKFKTLTSQVQDQQTSADGTTTKLLIRLQVWIVACAVHEHEIMLLTWTGKDKLRLCRISDEVSCWRTVRERLDDRVCTCVCRVVSLWRQWSWDMMLEQESMLVDLVKVVLGLLCASHHRFDYIQFCSFGVTQVGAIHHTFRRS